MSTRGDVLRQVMDETQTTQSALARVCGVPQPSISRFVSGRTGLSDDMLERLLSCMGYAQEVVRHSRRVELNRNEERSWRLHCRLAQELSASTLLEWVPVIEDNLSRLDRRLRGQPHLGNLQRWAEAVSRRDEREIRRVMTGLDRDSIEMREVSPLAGLLAHDARDAVLADATAHRG